MLKQLASTQFASCKLASPQFAPPAATPQHPVQQTAAAATRLERSAQPGASERPLYLLLISLHGLIRGQQLELGRDADTGGQTKYVVELAKALAQQPHVEQVDLVTRLVVDAAVSDDYAQPIEPLGEHCRIVRLPAGPEAYIAKEQLWPYLGNFADTLHAWLKQQPRWPDLIHTHYADAGYVGVRLANLTGLPLVHTGHSLGRDKTRRLLAVGMAIEQIEARYHMIERISAEEDTLSHASLVITSTRNEIESQYELYDYYTPEKMAVIPPGTDLQQFFPPSPEPAAADPSPIQQEINKFLADPTKPMILALSRADERKNIIALLEAFGQEPRLKAMANLVIVMGNRDDIRELHEGAQHVLTEILLVIDALDLYGVVALPKHHQSSEVPAIYRSATASRGVFVNPALTEPFGLTLLEAAASGLPLVATDNGGPVDILGNCRNGLLVDPTDRAAIASALLAILADPQLWARYSQQGLINIARYYSWEAHASRYLTAIRPIIEQHRPPERPPASGRIRQSFDRAIFTAVDNTLLGDDEGLEALVKVITAHRRAFMFGVATGRRLDSVLMLLKRKAIPAPDILITSLGTEIYYTGQLFTDVAWNRHINHAWTPQVLKRVMDEIPGLTLQPKSEQSRYKLSYYYDAAHAPPIEDIHGLLHQQELSVNATYSFGQYLDIVPARASKGQALRYVASQYEIPLEQILVTGGSGGDEDMLRGNTLGVVVANRHQEELANLSEWQQVYFAAGAHSWGILDAIHHYNFFQRMSCSVA
ncbi:HAD-IIB family hydrolase [Synechococcus sp. L2F]|uniref:HAD-IIB family hydrolase n=1 Tax=Synechococcus sp. L2F TaxID=2823739 RepID=UPI0020CE32DC|nr:HAD-IIB family hydrolase [Synechococcus sp. L2F]